MIGGGPEIYIIDADRIIKSQVGNGFAIVVRPQALAAALKVNKMKSTCHGTTSEKKGQSLMFGTIVCGSRFRKIM